MGIIVQKRIFYIRHVGINKMNAGLSKYTVNKGFKLIRRVNARLNLNRRYVASWL